MKRVVGLVLMSFLLLAASAPLVNGQISTAPTYLYENPPRIHLPCGIQLDPLSPDPPLPASLLLSEEQKGIGTYLVAFDGPIYAEERDALEQTGAVIDVYLPHYTYVVRMDRDTKSQVSALPGVRWVGDYQPGYKICPEIDLESTVPQEMLLFFYADANPDEAVNVLETSDGEILMVQSNDREIMVLAKIAPNRIPDIVHFPELKWIEPYFTPYVHNGRAQWVIQTWEKDNRRIWDEGIKGEGQIVNIIDSGVRTTHNFYRDESVSITNWGLYPSHRKIIAYQKTQGQVAPEFGDHSGHGTHVSGSALGNDRPVGGSSENIGMAPEAKLYFLDGGTSAYPNSVFVNPDLEVELSGAYGGGARISSLSWGSQNTRSYDSRCVSADRAMWNRKDFLVLTSAGNTSGGPYTGSPGNAKNLVCVGACGNGSAASGFASSVSSVGPAGDGRIRPDIVTPGSKVTSAWHTGDDNEYEASGTSMSSPIAAGAATLIRQYFTDGWYPTGSPGYTDAFEPSGALIKAMLINSVEFYFGRPIPDIGIGWGRPNLDNVLYFEGDDRQVSVVDYTEGLSTGKQFSYEVEITDDGEPLRITLNWTDAPGAAFADPALVNDLNLEVISPSGKTYRGNNFGTEPPNENESLEDGEFDELNPTENVFIHTPELGKWEIRVLANNVPMGSQPFALVVTFSGTSGITEKDAPLNPDLTLETSYDASATSFCVSFNLPVTEDVHLEMFDPTGRRIKTLLHERGCPAGAHRYVFSATDETDRRLPSGIYFFRLRCGEEEVITKTLVLK